MIQVIAGDKTRNIQAPDYITVNGVPHYFVMYNHESDTFIVSKRFLTAGYNIPADGNWNLDDEIPSYTYKEKETMVTITEQRYSEMKARLSALEQDNTTLKQRIADLADIHDYYVQKTEDTLNNARNYNDVLFKENNELNARNAYLEVENEHFPDELDALKYQIMQLEAKLEDNSETPSSQ